MKSLTRIAHRIVNQPLLIEPGNLATIAGILQGIGVDATGLRPESEETEPIPALHVGAIRRDATGAQKAFVQTIGGTAIIQILGVLIGRGGWAAASGVTTYQTLKSQISAAAKDPTVGMIVLDVDSPGGEAVGAFETADVVREAAQVKPVIAIVGGMGCSAAYMIASAATRLVTTKSSVLGSLGTVLLHVDFSHKLHGAGVVPTLVSAGKRKTDGSPYRPLTDEVTASLKSEVEKFNSLLVTTVAENRRGLSKRAILAMEAATFVGSEAVRVGLADAVVGSLEQILATFSGRTEAAPTSRKHDFFLQALDAQTVATTSIERVTQILSAGQARGLEKAAKCLASLPADKISTEAALELLALPGPKASFGARAGECAFGLVFLDDRAAGDRGAAHPMSSWSDIVASVNKESARP